MADSRDPSISRPPAILSTAKMDVKGVELDNKRTKEETGTPIGTEAWDSTTQLINGDDLGIISEYDTKASKFSQFVKVEHDKAFVLKPLTLTSGPLKGCHVLVLDTSFAAPSVAASRSSFMDLAAELRCKVYGFLLEEEGPIKIAMYRRRPVREGYGYETREKQEDHVWNVRLAKWIDQPPSNLAIMSVNKQIHQETAPIVYGQTFSFEHLTSFKAFARHIGNMCENVKHVEFKCTTWSRGTNPFLLLLQFAHLRCLTIRPDEGLLSVLEGPSLERFVRNVKEPLKMFDFLERSNGSEVKALDMFRVAPERCSVCIRREKQQQGHYYSHPSLGLLSPGICTCENMRKECGDIEARLRALLAQALEEKTSVVEDSDTGASGDS